MNKYLLAITLFLFSCNENKISKAVAPKDEIILSNDHDTLGEVIAREQLNEALEGKGQVFTWDTLIRNSSTAISIAEPLLFNVFGKDQILSEKPYEVHLIDGYWYISGTIPKGSKGGGFEIIFSAKNAEIIRLTHYK